MITVNHIFPYKKMKKFIITQEMLGRKEVVFILTEPIPEYIIKNLKEEIANEEGFEEPIRRFLMDFSTVKTMLKKNMTDQLTSAHVEMALANVQKLPQRVQHLIGPQIFALMKISPRLNILSKIKRYLDMDVIGYVMNRRTGYHQDVLEATAFILDAMDEAEGFLSYGEVIDVTNTLRTSLRQFAAPLYGGNNFRHHHKTELDEHDIITRQAFDAILGTQDFLFFDPDFLRRLIILAKELRYTDSEVWAIKVLLIRKMCDVIHWRHLAGITIDLKERIDFLLYAQELGKEVGEYSSVEKNKRVTQIGRMILQRLVNAEKEIYSEYEEEEKEDETALEYLKKKQAEKRQPENSPTT